MTEKEAIARARDWAASQGYRLDSECLARLMDKTCGLRDRVGWWYLEFTSGYSLCGGYGPTQGFWINDTTGTIEWVNVPDPLTWYQRLRRSWYGELAPPGRSRQR